MKYANNITAEYLRSVLDYDPNTGEFKWKINKQRARIGKIAGANQNGYITIGIDNKDYRAHRLAWLWMTGDWPKEFIDHINGIRSDNRWCNLREASAQQNLRNKSGVKNTSSKYKGVYWDNNAQKWKMVITTYFNNETDAAISYNKVAELLFGKFAQLNLIQG